MSISLCVGHTGELRKDGWTDRDAVWRGTHVRPKNHYKIRPPASFTARLALSRISTHIDLATNFIAYSSWQDMLKLPILLRNIVFAKCAYASSSPIQIFVVMPANIFVHVKIARLLRLKSHKCFFYILTDEDKTRHSWVNMTIRQMYKWNI